MANHLNPIQAQGIDFKGENMIMYKGSGGMHERHIRELSRLLEVEKQKLREAREVIDFYGNQYNWRPAVGMDQYAIRSGGKRARDFLKKYPCK